MNFTPNSIEIETIKSNPVISHHKFIKKIIPINARFRLNISGITLGFIDKPLDINLDLSNVKYSGIIVDYEPIDSTISSNIQVLYSDGSEETNYYIGKHKCLISGGMIGFSENIF